MENDHHNEHQDIERLNLPPPEENEEHMSTADTAELGRLTADELVAPTPEDEASERFRVDLDNYERAKNTALKILGTEAEAGNTEGIAVGELVKQLGKFGISEHLASQAIDAMRGRQVRITDFGMVGIKAQS